MSAVSVIVVTSGKAEGEMVAADLARNCALRYGGASIYQGNGLYVNEDGMLIHDQHILVKCFVQPVDLGQGALDWFSEQADHVRELLGEEAVSVVYSPHEYMYLVKGEGGDGANAVRAAHGSTPGEYAEVLPGIDPEVQPGDREMARMS